MQLSRFTDYTLRVLIYVAMNNDRRTTLTEIADFYGISAEHLRKVVHSLSKSGYLETFRGKNGGLQLGMPASDINIGKIVAQAEGNEQLIDCEGQNCLLANCCSLRGALAQAHRAFLSTLGQYNLEQVLQNPNMQSTLIATDKA
ncbi:MAG: RrF2 family transcriptional regulator [Pontibacterium sp.]